MSGIQSLKVAEVLKPRDISLKEFYAKRNRVLVIRDTGGLGDILMLRMMFEDFKRIMPDAYIVLACPLQYHDAVRDHPYIDEVIDARYVELSEFMLSYNVSTACGKHERRVAPLADKHRSDIWAHRCGIDLEYHDMHLSVPEGVTGACRAYLETLGGGPIVLLSPVSAIPSKDLDEKQSNEIIAGLRKIGCSVACLHKSELKGVDAPTISAESVIDFLGFINAADYIVTVDTATFHAAGGLKKPMVAIFSWADGKVYGRWFEKFILIQRHRDDGDWDCGPCYLWHKCPRKIDGPRKPCITEITPQEVIEAVERMMRIWPCEGTHVG